MTTVWDLIFYVLTMITEMMVDADFFYSISVWDIFIIMVVLVDIKFIVSGIFGGEENGDDN